MMSTLATLLILTLSGCYSAFRLTTPLLPKRKNLSLKQRREQPQISSDSTGASRVVVRQQSQLNLFFQQQQSHVRSPWRADWSVSPDLLESLSNTETFSLPMEFELEYQGDTGNGQGEERPSSPAPTVRIRKLRLSDLDQVVPLCVQEFGDFAINETVNFPWDDLQNEDAVGKWVESIMFDPLIRFALSMKIKFMEWAEIGDILLCLEERGRCVAIAELSLQPLIPERNPTPIPLPLWLKRVLAQSHGVDGWVTNLLVAPEVRGRGYSKALMKAIEGVAKQWPGCTSISLHVDADPSGGRVPQALYLGLGYNPVIVSATQDRYKWMGPEQIERGLVVVEGVPLLFLRKYLFHRP